MSAGSLVLTAGTAASVGGVAGMAGKLADGPAGPFVGTGASAGGLVAGVGKDGKGRRPGGAVPGGTWAWAVCHIANDESRTKGMKRFRFIVNCWDSPVWTEDQSYAWAWAWALALSVPWTVVAWPREMEGLRALVWRVDPEQAGQPAWPRERLPV